MYNLQDQLKPVQIWLLPLTGQQRTPARLLAGPYNLEQAQFSPDGRFIAYRSRESGSWEVFVQPFPANGKKWQISNAGGNEPQWRGDGKELFYYSGSALMSVDIRQNGGELEAALQAASAEATALRNSASWRITGPLRDVYGWWLRMRGAP